MENAKVSDLLYNTFDCRPGKINILGVITDRNDLYTINDQTYLVKT